jgi:hypothetical protein
MTEADQIDYDRAISWYMRGKEFSDEHANAKTRSVEGP